MYHEVTYADMRKGRRARRGVAVVVLLVVALLVFAAMGARSAARNQAAASVRAAILDSAVQCCAVEGSYPSSIEHLEANYGLAVNRSDYVVIYEWLGDNVVPSVVVRPR